MRGWKLATSILVAVAATAMLASAQSSTELAKRKAAAVRLRAAAHGKNARTGSGSGNDNHDPTGPPSGWTCAGYCGEDNADGSVTLSPTTDSFYEFVSTNGGTNGVGCLPSGCIGSETDGSTLQTSNFTVPASSPLTLYFNFVTSDGAGFSDYAWAELYSSSNTPVALLFTARTETSGSIVPGTGLPAPAATLTPASVPIIAGGPTWAPLGSSSGACYSAGCGYTGWVKASYTIASAGTYYLKVGTVNWIDTEYDTGLAVDGITANGTAVPVGAPTTAPAPPTLLLALFGLAASGIFLALSRRRTA